MAEKASVQCDLYASAFPSEAVFAIATFSKGTYEGVAPRHYVEPATGLSEKPLGGQIRVRLIRNGGGSAVIATPDGEVMEVAADLVKRADCSNQ